MKRYFFSNCCARYSVCSLAKPPATAFPPPSKQSSSLQILQTQIDFELQYHRRKFHLLGQQRIRRKHSDWIYATKANGIDRTHASQLCRNDIDESPPVRFTIIITDNAKRRKTEKIILNSVLLNTKTTKPNKLIKKNVINAHV